MLSSLHYRSISFALAPYSPQAITNEAGYFDLLDKSKQIIQTNL